MGIEWIRWNTRALLGENEDLSYITEAWLAKLERNGVEVSAAWPFRADRELTFYGSRLVDAVKYVAFEEEGPDAEEEAGETQIVWVEKPVEIVCVDRPAGSVPRYAVRQSALPPTWAMSVYA